MLLTLVLDLEENDDQREQGERLHKRQAECEQKQDARARARIPGQRFCSRRGRPALAEAAKSGGKPHPNTRCDGYESMLPSRPRPLLGRRLG